MYDIIIIGGGVSGMTSAIYAARAGKKVKLLEGTTFGGQITSSPKVSNYPGILEISGLELADLFYSQVENLDVDIEYEEVLKLEVIDTGIKVTTDDNTYIGKSAIVASGARHRALNIDNEEALVGNGISYCALCDGPFYKGENVAVVGSGNSALENAIFLSEYCNHVDVLVRGDHLKGEVARINRLKEKDNVDIHFKTTVQKLNGLDILDSIIINKDGNEQPLDVKGVFVSIGQEPHHPFLPEDIKLDSYGYIITDDDCKTNVEGIFAAGDCRSKKIRQLTTATNDGTIAAISACNYLEN